MTDPLSPNSLDEFLRKLGTPALKASFPVGRHVECDACGFDLTEDERAGGYLFGSKGYGPCCAAERLKQILAYGEEHFIQAYAPEDRAFADWIRDMRGPDAAVRIYGGTQ
jgi:hypothetical protein